MNATVMKYVSKCTKNQYIHCRQLVVPKLHLRLRWEKLKSPQILGRAYPLPRHIQAIDGSESVNCNHPKSNQKMSTSHRYDMCILPAPNKLFQRGDARLGLVSIATSSPLHEVMLFVL
jgi:hypothetical protein